MALKDVAHDYFSKLNPIATRICNDIDETKEVYDKLWGTLSEKEREQILNESIIKPEILLKYGNATTEKPESLKYASKIIVDDHCSYKDEHSAPFSFRTPSQRDLTIFACDKEVEEPKRVRVPVPAPARAPEVKEVPKKSPITETASTSSLPRTGLDLLDNW